MRTRFGLIPALAGPLLFKKNAGAVAMVSDVASVNPILESAITTDFMLYFEKGISYHR